MSSSNSLELLRSVMYHNKRTVFLEDKYIKAILNWEKEPNQKGNLLLPVIVVQVILYFAFNT